MKKRMLTDKEIVSFGIRIIEDGSGFKSYRRFLYNNILLGLNHNQMYLGNKNITKEIFKAGQQYKMKELHNVLNHIID